MNRATTVGKSAGRKISISIKDRISRRSRKRSTCTRLIIAFAYNPSTSAGECAVVGHRAVKGDRSVTCERAIIYHAAFKSHHAIAFECTIICHTAFKNRSQQSLVIFCRKRKTSSALN